jgi:IS5 family transposase
MRSDITPGQTSDYLGFNLVMDNNLAEPCVLLADRGYDSDKVRETMEARNVVPVIPMRKSRKLRVAVDRTLYRLRTSSSGASTSSRTPDASPPAMTRPPRASSASST